MPSLRSDVYEGQSQQELGRTRGLEGSGLCAVHTALLFAITVSIGACSVGPDYTRPTAPVSNNFKELKGWKIATPLDQMERGDWWSVYGDATLTSLLRKVDIGNQNVVSAEAAFRQSVAMVKQARAGLFPALNFSYTGNRWHEGEDAVDASFGVPLPSVTQTTVNVQPQLSWEADVWGKIRRQVQSNVSNAQAMAADYANARLSAQTQLALAYFNLRAADSLQRLLNETVETYSQTYEIALDRYNAGAASQYDVATAKAQVETARAQAVNVGVQRARYEHAIAVLIGLPPAELSIGSAPLANRVPVIPPSVPSALLERRPDIAAAERTIASQNAIIGVAVAAYFPDLSLAGGIGAGTASFASFGYMGASAFPIAVGNEVWSVGGNLAEVIFDAGLRREKVAAALASYYQSVAIYRQTVLTALQQVEDQLSNLRILAQQAHTLDKAVALSRKALDITMTRYKAGALDFTAVVQAQQVLLSNEVNSLTIRQNRFLASVSLIQALGGGWNSSWLPDAHWLKHWKTCVSVRDTVRGRVDPEMPTCL